MSPSSQELLLSVEWNDVNESYRSLPLLYLVFLVVWCITSFSWVFNTWRNRQFGMNKLQSILASVPLVKAVQLGCSFLFWYSCMNLQICSLWMSFGAYVAGVLFQTASFVCSVLISHGYCIMCERLSVSERRSMALLGFVMYLVLVGYKAALPYFSVVLLLSYLISLYVIFRCVSRNLANLREQLSCIEAEDVHPMYNVLQSKYTMFKKFHTAMQILAVTELAIHVEFVETREVYWFQIFVREWAQLCIFLYIGWTFRSRAVTSRFFVMPSLKSKGNIILPPIYSIEMDATDFKKLDSQVWQVGVPTSFPSICHGKHADSLIIIVQHPTPLSRNSESSSVESRSATAETDLQCGAKNIL